MVVIAIDGPAGSGKGTLGRALATELDLAYLDTGKLYRAVALRVIELRIDPSDAGACTAVAVALDPADLDAPGLRAEGTGQVASRVSSIPGVRAALFDFQRRFAGNPPGGKAGTVLDGRDIGTIVCPDADLKIFLVADAGARARRRFRDASADGEDITLEGVASSIRERDEREASRAIAPMRPADDALVVDSSEITAAEVLEMVVGALASRLPVPAAPALRM